jgi:soluble lytic murein transglycosylase-like protein
VDADVAGVAPAVFTANSFAGPQPGGALAPEPTAPVAEPVALMPRTRPLAVVEGGGDDVNRLIEKYATFYEVPVQLVRRVVKRESNFYPGAYNRGHWGLMQIKHATARGMGYDGPARGLLDAETNLKFAVKYLRGAWMVAKGNPDLAVRFYARGYYYDAKRMNLLDETGLGRDRVRRRRV